MPDRLECTKGKPTQPADKKKAPAEAGAIPRSTTTGLACSALRQDNTCDREVAQVPHRCRTRQPDSEDLGQGNGG
jgi:hypothetical protein